MTIAGSVRTDLIPREVIIPADLIIIPVDLIIIPVDPIVIPVMTETETDPDLDRT